MNYATSLFTAFIVLILTHTNVHAQPLWHNGRFTSGSSIRLTAAPNGSFAFTLYPDSTMATADLYRFAPQSRQFTHQGTFTTDTLGQIGSVSWAGKALVLKDHSPDSTIYEIISTSSHEPLDRFGIGKPQPLASKPQRIEEALSRDDMAADSTAVEYIYQDDFIHTLYWWNRRVQLPSGELATGWQAMSRQFTPQHYPGFILSEENDMVASVTHKQKEFYLELWYRHTYPGWPASISLPGGYSAYISVSGSEAAYIDTSGNIRVVNIRTATVATPSFPFPVDFIRLQNNGQYLLATATEPQSGQIVLYIWDVEARALLHTIHTHVRRAWLAALSEDGKTVGIITGPDVACPVENTPEQIYVSRVACQFYNVATGELIGRWPNNGHTDNITSTAWSPDGTLVASAGMDLQTMWHNAATGDLVGTIPGSGVLLFANATTLLRASGNSIEKIDLATASIVQEQQLATSTAITALRISHNGSTIAAATESDITLLSYPGLVPMHTVVPSPPQTISDIAFTGTGNVVALVLLSTNTTTAVATVWNATTGVQISATTVEASHAVVQAELSADGKQLVLWSSTPDSLQGKIYTTDGQLLRSIQLGNDNQNQGHFDSEFSSDASSLYLIRREWFTNRYKESNTYLRQTIRRFAVNDTASEIVGFSEWNAKAGLLRIAPDQSRAAYSFSSEEDATCSEGVLESVRLAPVPAITFAPSSIDFDTVYVGESHERKITITSGNSSPVVLLQMSFYEFDTWHGISVQYNHSFPDTLMPGDERTLTVTMAPPHYPMAPEQPALSNVLDSIVFTTLNGYDDAIKMNIYGTVIGPALATDIPEINFGDVPIGSWQERSIVVSGSNKAGITMTKAILEDPNYQAMDFSITAGVVGTVHLNEGETKEITIRYTPTREEERELSLLIASNDTAAHDFRIPIRARGVLVTSTAELAVLQQLRISPQPASSILTISFETAAPGTASIELFSTEGRLAAAKYGLDLGTGTHTTTLSVEHVPAGVYVCRIKTPAGTITKPVVISP